MRLKCMVHVNQCFLLERPDGYCKFVIRLEDPKQQQSLHLVLQLKEGDADIVVNLSAGKTSIANVESA